MGDEQNNKNILDIINEHPVIKRYAKKSIIGLIGAIFIAVFSERVINIELSEICEWSIKLKDLIQSVPYIVIIFLFIITLLYLYFSKNKGKEVDFKKRFLKNVADMVGNDPSISNVTIKEDRKEKSLSINIQRNNEKSLAVKTDSNIIEFKSHNNLEVK